MAECHPVAFQWVMEAKARGAVVIHVDPRFTRTSALADLHVGLRAGSDIAFLGGVVRYVLEGSLEFREYVVAYTNAARLVREDFADTEDLDGLFSGYQESTHGYDTATWQLEDGPGDPTLEHPRCVYQVLRRHFARYTPELVEQVCGVPPAVFEQVCRAWTANSGPDRTTGLVYSVGWTHHTVGVQYIRTAAILQTLLGNMGRPGGGILALRGHASIQGSTDIPPLYDLLPGYLPMPDAASHPDLDTYVESLARTAEGAKGFWGEARAYTVSLLKAWWGEQAQPENDFRFDWLPRINGDHSTYQTVMNMIDGTVKGYFLVGENPAVGSAHGSLQRKGMANLDWLVVRDFSLIESATFWKDGPEVETGEMSPERIRTEVFFFPAASHVEKEGSFTNTQRMLQWHSKAVDPPGDARSDLHFYYHLGRRLQARLASSTDPRDLPLQKLTWDYPTEGAHQEPSAEAVLAEVNGADAAGAPLSSFTQMRADGSTSGGCWIYTGVYAGGVNQAARRRPQSEQSWVAPEWGWAWPANRRILYNRASADPQGRPWSPEKAYVWWDPERGEWTGHDVADFEATKPPTYVPPPGATGVAALAGDDPFVMQADGKAWLFAPGRLKDGPLPAHYEPAESPVRNRVYGQQANPTRQLFRRPEALVNPSPPEPGSGVFPYVFTTYRLTEHHTAGGMSRFLPYLSELQPAFFCEVSPELARQRGLTHLGWATIVTSRAAIEARVLVTARMTPVRLGEELVHQVGLPYHWGGNGLTTGDSANDLLGLTLDPNVHIQESKAASCDIQPGRRPRGPALLRLVEQYRSRAGVTAQTGGVALTPPAHPAGAAGE